MGIRPLSRTSSIYKSAIFQDLYRKWTLHVEGRMDVISKLSEISDGGNLILCCGDNWKLFSDADDRGEVNLLELIPAKFKKYRLTLASSTPTNDCEDPKRYISECRPPSPEAPEVIDLVDCSSSDDSSPAMDSTGCGGGARSDCEVYSIASDDDSSDIEDVTEIYLAKRNAELQQMIDDAEEVNDTDDEGVEIKQGMSGNKRKRQSHRSPSCLIELLIDEKDMPLCPGARLDKDAGTNAASDNIANNRSIKQRIVKLLNTGFHGESNEHEARNAMKLARKLMDRYNLDQAVLLQERGDGSLNDFSTANDDDGSALTGGLVTVKIINKKSKKPLSSLPRWLNYLIGTVSMNFHVDAFKSVNNGAPSLAGECSVTFYGLRANAQLAAYAYKIAGERCSQMASTYHDEPPSKKLLPTRNLAATTRTARLSYALGVVNGLHRDVKEGLRKEEEKRQEKLTRAQQRAANGEAYNHDSSSDEDEDATTDDQKVQGGGRTKLEHLERENTAHLALIDHNKKIAADVLKVSHEYIPPASIASFPEWIDTHYVLLLLLLKSKNIKIQTAKKSKSIELNMRAYEKGVIDSKEIDLNQQAINNK
jgi:hypothetical protein